MPLHSMTHQLHYFHTRQITQLQPDRLLRLFLSRKSYMPIRREFCSSRAAGTLKINGLDYRYTVSDKSIARCLSPGNYW